MFFTSEKIRKDHNFHFVQYELITSIRGRAFSSANENPLMIVTGCSDWSSNFFASNNLICFSERRNTSPWIQHLVHSKNIRKERQWKIGLLNKKMID
jgi:hypothetical protein